MFLILRNKHAEHFTIFTLVDISPPLQRWLAASFEKFRFSPICNITQVVYVILLRNTTAGLSLPKHKSRYLYKIVENLSKNMGIQTHCCVQYWDNSWTDGTIVKKLKNIGQKCMYD